MAYLREVKVTPRSPLSGAPCPRSLKETDASMVGDQLPILEGMFISLPLFTFSLHSRASARCLQLLSGLALATGYIRHGCYFLYFRREIRDVNNGRETQVRQLILPLDVTVKEDQVIYTESPSIRIKAWGSDPQLFHTERDQHPLKVFDSLTHSRKDQGNRFTLRCC